jgi:hypothetical protein
MVSPLTPLPVLLHPFKNNAEIQKRITNNINLYRIGGIELIVYGFIKILE